MRVALSTVFALVGTLSCVTRHAAEARLGFWPNARPVNLFANDKGSVTYTYDLPSRRQKQPNPATGNPLSFNGILKTLFGGNSLDSTSQTKNGCLSILASKGDPVSLVIISVVEQAVSTTLKTCYDQAPQQQLSTWVDVIPQLFAPQPHGQTADFGSILLGALDRSCNLAADREFCRVFRDEFESPRCNLCRLIALVFKPVQIKTCACQIVGGIAPSSAGIRRSINTCVGSVAAGGILKDKFGTGGWIPVPGC